MWVSRSRFEALEMRVQVLEQALSNRPSDGGFQPGASAWPALEPSAVGTPNALALNGPGLDLIRATLAQGRTIEAIKLYRQQTNVSLIEAKDAVEAMQRMA